jgi:uncharacterized protein
MSPQLPEPPVIALGSVVPPLIAPQLSNAPGQPARPWGFWATFGLGLATLFASLSMQGVVGVLWVIGNMIAHAGKLPSDLDRNGLFLATATIASAPVMIGLSWLFSRIRHGLSPLDYLSCRWPRRSDMVRWTIVMLIFLLLSDALTHWLARPIIPEFMTRIYRTAGFLPLFWLAIVVAAPLAEETLFRGFLFEGFLHSRLGATGAIFLTSLLWSAIHLQYDAYGIATIFVAGLLLGYVRLRTRSLYATISLHCLMNVIATIETAVILCLSPSAS